MKKIIPIIALLLIISISGCVERSTIDFITEPLQEPLCKYYEQIHHNGECDGFIIIPYSEFIENVKFTEECICDPVNISNYDYFELCPCPIDINIETIQNDSIEVCEKISGGYNNYEVICKPKMMDIRSEAWGIESIEGYNFKWYSDYKMYYVNDSSIIPNEKCDVLIDFVPAYSNIEPFGFYDCWYARLKCYGE